MTSTPPNCVEQLEGHLQTLLATVEMKTVFVPWRPHVFSIFEVCWNRRSSWCKPEGEGTHGHGWLFGHAKLVAWSGESLRFFHIVAEDEEVVFVFGVHRSKSSFAGKYADVHPSESVIFLSQRA